MRLSKSDLFFTLSVFIVSALFFKLFIDDINAISTKNAESAATIIFKKNNAQRQFSSSLKWERLKNQSPVYNGDTLRTGNNSEAALFFEDGTKLDFADNTLIQIRSALKNNTVDFFGGNMSFKSNNKSDKSTVINTPDGSKINLSKDAVASLIQSGDKLFIGLDTGKASIEKDGASQDIDKNKELAINIESGEITVTNRKIFPITPEPDARYIAIAKNSVKINFVCESEEIVKASEAFVELSPNPDFEESVISIKANYQDKKISSEVDTPDGGWFWRIKLITDNETIYSSARRIMVYKEDTLKLISPLKNSDFTYRKKNPSISLAWSESKYAEAYILEIADNKEFNNPKIKTRSAFPEIIISDLNEGLWYWRVTPVYSFLDDKNDFEIETSLFRIIRNTELEKIVTYIPTDSALFEINKAKNKGIGFSWKPNSEAIIYEMGIASDKDMNNIVGSFTTKQSWFKLKDELIKFMLREGIWYWAVRCRDNEGSLSPWSEIKKITGVDAVISQRLIYPPENYIIADSLVTNTRFSWRTNIPTKKIFQVSKSANFKEIVYQENVETETLLGKNWGIGKYYWRIRNFNADGSVFLDSDTRSFEVTGLLAATNLITPVSGSTVIALEDTIDKIEWSRVKNADYYSIEIFVDGKLIEDIPVYTKTEYEIMFAKYENASWNLKIRALANENEKATRLLGYIGEFSFNVRTLKPIVINSPKDGEAFSGLDAIRKGIVVEWDSEEDLKTSTMLISKDKEGKKIVFKKNAPLKSDSIPKLKEGVYFCNLLGRTSSGYDITTKSPISFIVEKIPNLPTTSRTDPADGGVIDFEYLKTRKSIVLEWDNIDGANCYELRLYRISDNKLIFQDDFLKDNFYKFVNLKEFSRGEFKWTLKGKSQDSNGVIEQNGEILESVFRLDIPEISKQEEKKIEGLYGQ